MTDANMQRHKYSYYNFWAQLKPATIIILNERISRRCFYRLMDYVVKQTVECEVVQPQPRPQIIYALRAK